MVSASASTHVGESPRREIAYAKSLGKPFGI